MNYLDITKTSLVNGPGVRTVLWVAGCNHHCFGCQNVDTWNPDGGRLFNTVAETKLFSILDKKYRDGLTLSGGDPLYITNRSKILSLCKRFRHRYDNRKTIWLYTGYLWEEVQDLEIMEYLDVVVDGPYIENLRDVNYKWAGSVNQRIIDVPKSKEYGRIVLYEQK